MASPVALTVKNLPAMQKTRVDPWIRKIPWRRKWQPTSEFLPGESLGPRSLVGYSPWGRKSQTRLKQLSTHTHVPGGLCFLRKIISRVWIPLMQKATRPQKPHQIQSSQPHLVLGFVLGSSGGRLTLPAELAHLLWSPTYTAPYHWLPASCSSYSHRFIPHTWWGASPGVSFQYLWNVQIKAFIPQLLKSYTLHKQTWKKSIPSCSETNLSRWAVKILRIHSFQVTLVGGAWLHMPTAHASESCDVTADRGRQRRD